MKLDSIPSHITQLDCPYHRNQWIISFEEKFCIVFIYHRFSTEQEVMDYIASENADTVVWRTLSSEKVKPYRLSALNVKYWIEKQAAEEDRERFIKSWDNAVLSGDYSAFVSKIILP